MSIRPLDASSIHSLTSGQVITSLSSAVKELVENSLDAGATVIDVRLFGAHGTTGLSVTDNGCGIPSSDYDVVALKHHTSKLTTFEDLASVNSFGFRGEALASLCGLAEKVTITTAVEGDAPLGTVLRLDNNGAVIDQSQKVARQRGTTIHAENLFATLPVRQKHFIANAKRDFPKLLSLLTAYALVPCTQADRGVRFSVTSIPDKSKNSKSVTHLRTSGQPSLQSVISTLWGVKQLSTLTPLSLKFDVNLSSHKTILKRPQAGLKSDSAKLIHVAVRGYISNPSVYGSGRAQMDRQFHYINGRPCAPSKIQKATNEIFRSLSPSSSSSSLYPVVILDFILPTDCMDINVSPDKRTILLHGEDSLVSAFKDALEAAFPSSSSSYAVHPTQPHKITTYTSSASASVSSVTNIDGDNDAASSDAVNHEHPQSKDGLVESARRGTESPRSDDETSPYPVTPSTSVLSLPSRRSASSSLSGTRPSVGASRAIQTKTKQVQLTLSTANASWALRKSSDGHDRVRTSPPVDSEDSEADDKPEKSGSPSLPRKKPRLNSVDSSNDANRYDTIYEFSEGTADGELQGKGDTKERLHRQLLGFASSTHKSPSTQKSTVPLSSEDLAVQGDQLERSFDTDPQVETDIEMHMDEDAHKINKEFGSNNSYSGHGVQIDDGPSHSFRAGLQSEMSTPSQDLPSLFLTSPPQSPSTSLIALQGHADNAALAFAVQDEDELRSEMPSEGALSTASNEAIVSPCNEREEDLFLHASSSIEVLHPNTFLPQTQSLSQTMQVDLRQLEVLYASLANTKANATSSCTSETNPNSTQPSSPIAPSLSLRVIHKEDFLSISPSAETKEEPTLGSSSPGSLLQTKRGMHLVGQFNLGFIIVRLVRVHAKSRDITEPIGDGGERDSPHNEAKADTDDLFIIDQHAADEKYNFETLQATTRIDSQRLVRPRPLELTAADELLAIDNVELLRENGFEIVVEDDGHELEPSDRGDDLMGEVLSDEVETSDVQPVGAPGTSHGVSGCGTRVKLVALPVSGKTVFDLKDLEEILHLMHDVRPSPSSGKDRNQQRRMIRCTKARAMFASRACRKSVMIGMALKRSQMVSIVRHMGTMDQPWNCPHGRPTMRHLVSLSDIIGNSERPGALDYARKPINWARFSWG